MKLQTAQQPVLRGNVAREATFDIASRGKAYEILSGTIYTDPKLAIVRELSCNAVDAHVEAGKADIPFHIHLPNDLEPYFEVTDYGTGLSEDDIYRVFTVYFESTKDQSNDVIGAMGLGSKSPFSYSDAFEVTSRFNGTKTSYSMFKNEERIPSVVKVDERPTTEPNGVSVRITIASNDFRDFHTRTSSALKYFAVKPTVVGSANFEFESTPDDTISGSNWILEPVSSYGSSSTFVAVMGGVGYTVNLNQIRDLLTTAQIVFVERSALVLTFNIGDLDVPPSREEVRYDDNTKTQLANGVIQASTELSTQVSNMCDNIAPQTRWNVYTKLNEYSNDTFGSSYSLRTMLNAEGITNDILAQYLASDGEVASEVKDLPHHVVRSYAIQRRTSHLSRFNTPDRIKTYALPGFQVVLMDEHRGIMKKLAWYASVNKISTLIGIRPRDFKTTSTAADAEVATILDDLGKPPFIKCSDIILPEKEKTLQIAKSRQSYFYKYSGVTYKSSGYGKPRFSMVQTTDADAPTKGLYFLVQRHATPYFNINSGTQVTWGRSWESRMHQLLGLINEVKGTSYTKDDVWGAQKLTIKQTCAPSANWIDIFALANECIDHIKPSVDFNRRLEMTTCLVDVERFQSNRKLNAMLKGLAPDSHFREHLSSVIDAPPEVFKYLPLVGQAEAIDEALNDCAKFGDSPRKYRSGKPKTTTYTPLYSSTEVVEKYPMLSAIDETGDNCVSDMLTTHPETVIDYINLMDRTKS